MPTAEALREFLSQASATGSKSTAMQPLIWLTGILISGLILSSSLGGPEWILVLIACLLGVTVLIFIGSYIYYGVKSPDALRSEKFTLSKMAIEKNLVGDNLSGLIEVEGAVGLRPPPPPPPPIEGETE